MDPLRKVSKTTASSADPNSPSLPSSLFDSFQNNTSLIDSSSQMPLGNVSRLPNVNSPNATETNDELFQLEAVQEPYLTFVFVLFFLTSIVSLLLNILALILINAPSGRPGDQNQHSHRHQQHHLRVNRSQTIKNDNDSSNYKNKTNNVQRQALIDPVNQQTISKKQQRLSTKRSTASTGGSSHLRYYLINLFVNDILIALLSTPFTYTDYLYGQWLFPPLLCPVSNFISSCAVTVSVYTLIAIGLER